MIKGGPLVCTFRRLKLEFLRADFGAQGVDFWSLGVEYGLLGFNFLHTHTCGCGFGCGGAVPQVRFWVRLRAGAGAVQKRKTRVGAGAGAVQKGKMGAVADAGAV